MHRILLSLLLLPAVTSTAQLNLTIHFSFGDTTLSSSAMVSLDSLRRFLKQQSSGYLIQLKGHTDPIGSDRFNLALSRRRALAVWQSLVSHGIAATQFTEIVASGETEPVADNGSEAGRALNRRVEIGILMLTRPPVSETDNQLIRRFEDSSLSVGTRLVLQDLHFVGGRHQVLPGSIPVLEELAAAMRANPGISIEIIGHICCIADSTDGYDTETGQFNLSAARAEAIHDYLAGQGISRGRLRFRGMGHAVPLYPFPEKTEEERIANRRVEIRILGK